MDERIGLKDSEKKFIDNTLKITKIASVIGVIGIGIGIYLRNINLSENFLEHNKPIVGTVLEEIYDENTLELNTRRYVDWGIFGMVVYPDHTLKPASKYTLKVKANDGKVMEISVIDSEIYGGGTKDSLERIIEEGTRISLPKGNMRAKNFFSNFFNSSNKNYDLKETYFQDYTQFGTKRAYRIKVLDK